jgi:hypothetical protein
MAGNSSPHPSTSSPPSRPHDAMPPAAPRCRSGQSRRPGRGGRQPARVHMPALIQARLRPVSIRLAPFERLNPGRYSVWLRPGVPVASRNFFPNFFLSREREMGRDNSKCFLGSRDSKKLRGSRAASDATSRMVRSFVVSFSPAGGRRAQAPAFEIYGNPSMLRLSSTLTMLTFSGRPRSYVNQLITV